MKELHSSPELVNNQDHYEGLTEWEAFVLNHTKAGNHVLHFISSLCFFGAPLVALYTRNPYYLILFFISGGIGSLGHYLFHDGVVTVRNATVRFKFTFYVVRMFYLLALGLYGDAIRQAHEKQLANGAPG